jgi:hypothetical protein
LKVNNPHLSENKISLFGEFADFNIPFPRSSGARFCGDSKLVCFGLTRQYTVKVSHVLGTRYLCSVPDPESRNTVYPDPETCLKMSRIRNSVKVIFDNVT